MEGVEEELERRSKFLNSLIQKKKNVENNRMNVRVRASDMPFSLQNHAFRIARDNLHSMASGKVDSKRLALAHKKVVMRVFLLIILYAYLLNCTSFRCIWIR